mmetsp:Transcript_9109/g.31947  ORF Transcript_9109/g.31947 Transcript_9109/m.31947 type:complete len:226 (+) Transcript_9109:278-955(+)
MGETSRTAVTQTLTFRYGAGTFMDGRAAAHPNLQGRARCSTAGGARLICRASTPLSGSSRAWTCAGARPCRSARQQTPRKNFGETRRAGPPRASRDEALKRPLHPCPCRRRSKTTCRTLRSLAKLTTSSAPSSALWRLNKWRNGAATVSVRGPCGASSSTSSARFWTGLAITSCSASATTLSRNSGARTATPSCKSSQKAPSAAGAARVALITRTLQQRRAPAAC